MQEKSEKQNIMEAKETTKTKAAKAKAKDNQPSKSVKKSKFTEFWEKYPNGTTIVLDRRAILK
jgi:hypothetical protein